MASRDKARVAAAVCGLLAIVLARVAGYLGLAYWWIAFVVFSLATFVGIVWIETRSATKAFAIIMCLLIGALGWAIPFAGAAPVATTFSIAPFFWGAGVVLWRLAPFGIAIMIATMPLKRR